MNLPLLEVQRTLMRAIIASNDRQSEGPDPERKPKTEYAKLQ
jgi:hypothetical protein